MTDIDSLDEVRDVLGLGDGVVVVLDVDVGPY